VRSIPVFVSSDLRVDGNLLGHDLVEEIFDELEVPNEDRVKAERSNRWGWWDMPEVFQLGELDGDTVVMPRGYALQLKLLLREHRIKVIWVDRRKWTRGPAFTWQHEPDPRFSHQPLAVAKMVKHQQGIYEAPTGSGKTMAVIRFLHKVRPLNTVILVDKIDLMNQWIAAIEHWFGPGHVGQVGSGEWNDGERITVATVQTIWAEFKTSRGSDYEKLLDLWFEHFDCTTVDECHHVSAQSIEYVVGRFSARYRIGVSATPDRVDGKFEITQAVLGEVIHQDDEDKLRKLGILVKPHVEVIRTGFKFTYWSDHQSDEDGNCEKPGCKIRRPHGHHNNYQDLKDRLVYNEPRNLLVAAAVAAQCETGEHHHLVVSDEVRQLEAIYEVFNRAYANDDTPEMFMLTGRITGKRRKEMISKIKRLSSAIIFATVAKEGVDIPPIDRIYLPFPASNPKKVQQWIGRGTRSTGGKKSTIAFDFLDVNVGVLKSQFRSRRFKCYDKLGIEVAI
jgi:superfamily II DNA or RNA helicase